MHARIFCFLSLSKTAHQDSLARTATSLHVQCGIVLAHHHTVVVRPESNTMPEQRGAFLSKPGKSNESPLPDRRQD